jgi:hypothetical protein
MSKRHDQYMKEKLKELQPPDIIKQPEHYAQHPIQPVDFVMSNGLSFWAGKRHQVHLPRREQALSRARPCSIRNHRHQKGDPLLRDASKPA